MSTSKKPTAGIEVLRDSIEQLQTALKEHAASEPVKEIKQPALHAHTGKLLGVKDCAYGYFDEEVYLKEEVDKLLEKHGIPHD